MGPSRPVVESLATVRSDDVIVVGKVELHPPLSEDELSMSSIRPVVQFGGGCLFAPTGRQFKNTALLLTDTKMRKLTEPQIGDYTNRIAAPLDETFYVTVPNSAPLFVIRSEILMGVSADVEKAVLPSGYKIDIRRDDKAVYIGTLKYYRDEFSEIKRVELIDDYERENAAFKKIFGGQIKLRKALIKAEKSP